MKSLLLTISVAILCSTGYAQTVEELYKSKNFDALIKYENKAAELTGDELYMVGYAFYLSGNDDKAIAFYDKAMAKGLNNGAVHFYKGLSLCYEKKYEESMKEIDIAIKDEPANQEYLNQKGVIYYYQDQKDKALAVFEQAETLPRTYPEPYYWAAQIYHEKEEFAKALAAFYTAIKYLPTNNSNFPKALASIGQLEYTFTKDYEKSAAAYGFAIAMTPKNYVLYPKLMKAYNAAEEYTKADSIFELMKIAYNNKELPEDDMKFKNVAIDEYTWNDRALSIYKYLTDPEKPLDIYYKIILFNKEGNGVERTFLVEKMEDNPDNSKYIFCETNRKAGMHYTYPYGWKTETISIPELKKATELVLDGKMQYGAASSH